MSSPSNLKRWGLQESGQCTLCGKEACTIPHVLSGCAQALKEGRYRYRHDSVLRVLSHHVSGFVNRHNNCKGPKAKDIIKTIRFVPAGVTPPKTVSKGVYGKTGILGSARDWIMLVDLGRRLVFPDHIVKTSLRPDIVIYSNGARTVLMIELTCPSEENFEKRHEEKLNRYTDLQADCEIAGWKVYLYAVEVGARGYSAQSLSSCLRAVGLKQQLLKTCVSEVGDEALRTSFHIWMWRDSSKWCKVGYPEEDKLTSKEVDQERSETNCSSVAAVSEEPVNVKRSSAISSTPPQTVCSTKDSSVQPTKVTGKGLTERDEKEATVPTVECSPAPLEPRNLRSRGKLTARAASPKKTASTSQRPPGLQNLGNTCYLNSLLQALLAVPAFWDLSSHRLHSMVPKVRKQLFKTLSSIRDSEHQTPNRFCKKYRKQRLHLEQKSLGTFSNKMWPRS